MWKLRLVFIFSFVIFFSSALYSPSAASEQILKIGVASMYTPVDTVKYYQDIIDYISNEIERPIQMVHRRTYEEMDAMLEKGKVQIAFICTMSYVINRKKFGAELLAVPIIGGKTNYHSYIIVHRESPINSFVELRGKSFAFSDPKSNSGRLYPVYLLKRMGTNPEKFFKQYTYSYSHNKSIELVAKRMADGAAVDSLVYDYMLKKDSPYAKQVKVIKRSPPFGIPPVVVTKDIDPGLKNKIKKVLFEMGKNKKGKAILDAVLIDGFTEIPDSAYNSIREMEQGVAGMPPAALKISDKKVVYFGVVPKDNPRMLYEKYQPLLDYLSANTPFKYELILKKNYAETVRALGTGEITIALLDPLTYLDAKANFGAKCILKPRGMDGTATYRSVIITRTDSQIRTLSGLKGKKIAFSAHKATSGNLMSRVLLADNGIHLKDLEKHRSFDYHDSTIKAVIKGGYDAGAVRDTAAKKHIKSGIEILGSSEAIPIGPLTVSPGFAPNSIKIIKDALLELNANNPAHKEILKKLDDDLSNGFVETDAHEYENMLKKINTIQQTCGKGCHRRILR